MAMRTLFWSLPAALCVAASLTTHARAEFIAFDDSGSSFVTVTANGFLLSPLTVNSRQLTDGTSYNSYSMNVPKSMPISFTGIFESVNPVSATTLFRFASPLQPGVTLAEIGLSRIRLTDHTERVDGVFAGYGVLTADFNLAALLSDRVASLLITSELNAFPTYTDSFAIDGNLGLYVALDKISNGALDGGQQIATPEPVSAALLGGGAVMLWLARSTARRRRNASTP